MPVMSLSVALIVVAFGAAAPVSAQIRSTAPPLAPADAVAVLQSSHSPADVTHAFFYREPGPRWFVTGASGPTAGPWDWPPESPRLRLDGTPLSQPPDRYGPDFLFLPSFGASRGVHPRSATGHEHGARHR
jgi:hypothetical protein